MKTFNLVKSTVIVALVSLNLAPSGQAANALNTKTAQQVNIDRILKLQKEAPILSCVDARTGTAHYQERACGQSSASPVFADGRIYLLDEQGLGVVVKPGRTFEKLAENPLGERTLASYAVQDGALFIRSEEHLFRIGR